MDFETWWNDRKREGITILVMFILAVWILAAILLHWMPSSTFFLFLSDLFHQVLFYLGTVVAAGEWLMIKLLETPLEKKLFTTVAIVCLFVACFQAWVDEHHNATQLVQEKSQISSEKEFWRGQSYAKDDAIRSRDNLLQQNFTTWTTTQNNYNDLVIKLSNSQIVKINPLYIGQIAGHQKPEKGTVYGDWVITTNKSISPVHLVVTCNKPITGIAIEVAGGQNRLIGNGGQLSSNSFESTLESPPWTPTDPLIVTIYGNNTDIMPCKFEPK